MATDVRRQCHGDLLELPSRSRGDAASRPRLDRQHQLHVGNHRQSRDPAGDYNSAKAAVSHLTRSLAVEWIDRGVRVNAVSPGYTATPMTTRPEMIHLVEQLSREIPMGRYADPVEIAGPVVFLLSPAASYCTGVDLLVDGGFCCW